MIRGVEMGIYQTDMILVRRITDYLEQFRIQELADFFSCFADASRLRILLALGKEEQLCVHDLCETVNMSQPAVSHHLKKLRQSGAVGTHKQGKQIFYRILDVRIRNLIEFIEFAET